MKKTSLAAALLGIAVISGCSKKTTVTPSKNNGGATIEPADAPALTWKEHWFEHVQNLERISYDNSVVIYYDKDVRRDIVWPKKYMAEAWEYTKKTYGAFGDDPRLYAIYHAGKYSGGHPSTYMDDSHDFHNVTDCGSGDANAWVSGQGNDIDLSTHEIGHIVEGAAKGVHGSPAFSIWHDSKWMEIYQYDVYLGLGRNDDAVRWHNLKLQTTDDFPRAATHWYRDWFYPIYNDHGKTKTLNGFFTLLAKYFPKRTFNNGKQTYPEYSRDLNYGEFIHFWSGAAGTDLKQLALTAFGDKDEQGNDWTVQLEKAKTDFPDIKY
ncbi:hypothetical protein LJ707_06340 [Mucilaginibacter sp. UR6-1]|uniref:hypothetical protein n=1 Tax=Mucilaginibacter sp. UR6-1 TaxID=1435643 RepID=UPI001E642BF9|nr:hypothetical protein [Mucilaginibacter sp. UR6-1]MCC8408542.1 hypothetical protein [Mucilaginibacter sp. UR6-1]